jgi:hypothetical protein
VTFAPVLAWTSMPPLIDAHCRGQFCSPCRQALPWPVPYGALVQAFEEVDECSSELCIVPSNSKLPWIGELALIMSHARGNHSPNRQAGPKSRVKAVLFPEAKPRGTASPQIRTMMIDVIH